MKRAQSDALKKSPIRHAPLPAPGDTVNTDLYDLIVQKSLIPVVVAVMLSVLALTEWARWAKERPPSPVLYTAFAIIAIVWAAFSVRRTIVRGRQMQLGFEGERAVGQVLERLRRDGYEIFHDLGGDGFNIDHVIVGPPGVFVIETKTHRKRPGGDVAVVFDGTKILVDGHVPDRDPIVQVRAAVNHVRRLIEQSTTLKPFIKPVILYPGWYTKSASHNDVWVLNETAFTKFLEHAAVRLREDEVKLIASAIASCLRASQLAGT